MATNITYDEMVTVMRRAMQKANDLNIAGMVKYMLEQERDVTVEATRPLPGSGFIMRGKHLKNITYYIEVASADNQTDLVFAYRRDASQETITVFRDGPWVQMLEGAYNAEKYRVDNSETLGILRNFSPL